jgi:tyrosyl-tRNA synthetase
LGFMESYILRENSVSLVDLLIAVRLIESKGQAKHLINGNSITLNNKKVLDPKLIVDRSHCVENAWLMVGKGKSDRRLVLFR